MPQDIKIFRSKYWEREHKVIWIPIEKCLEDQGYIVYQQIEPCDIAFILCGLMENPNAFENKVLFYNSLPYRDLHSTNIKLRTGTMQTLLEYYDESYDLAGLSPDDKVEAIIEQYDAHQS
jgi:hypothetical protein